MSFTEKIKNTDFVASVKTGYLNIVAEIFEDLKISEKIEGFIKIEDFKTSIIIYLDGKKRNLPMTFFITDTSMEVNCADFREAFAWNEKDIKDRREEVKKEIKKLFTSNYFIHKKSLGGERITLCQYDNESGTKIVLGPQFHGLVIPLPFCKEEYNVYEPWSILCSS